MLINCNDVGQAQSV